MKGQGECNRSEQRDEPIERTSKGRDMQVIQGRVISYTSQATDFPQEGHKGEPKMDKPQGGWEQQNKDQERIKHLEGIVEHSYRQQSEWLNWMKGKGKERGYRKRIAEESEQEDQEPCKEIARKKDGREIAKAEAWKEEKSKAAPKGKNMGKE